MGSGVTPFQGLMFFDCLTKTGLHPVFEDFALSGLVKILTGVVG